jgi:hypothetical protein
MMFVRAVGAGSGAGVIVDLGRMWMAGLSSRRIIEFGRNIMKL